MRYGDSRGSYTIETLPGCAQVAVSCRAFVYKDKRGQGHGTALHQERLATMSKLGFDFALCTVRANNEAEVRILRSNGWTLLAEFDSSSSGESIHLYGRPVYRQLVGVEVTVP